MRQTEVFTEKPKEECGVFGIISPRTIPAVPLSASALMALQHRGEESAGIATFVDGNLKCKKGMGLVSEVFSSDYLEYAPKTKVAVGHVRYSTTGSCNIENAQPIETVHSKISLALAHNGNLTNSAIIRRELVQSGMVLHTTNDTEILNIMIVRNMIETGELERAIVNAMNFIEGAFSIVIATKDKLIAVRDPNGFRPLCMGRLGDAVVFASETCALDALGAEFERDVKPGEVVSCDTKGNINTYMLNNAARSGLCSFEFIYFARPDSVIDGISVYKAREQMGRALYIQRPTEADYVCGVPDSGLAAAQGYSQASGIPMVPAFVKNKYVGRSFILPDQVKRENAVNVKLNPIRSTVEGKRIVLIDDSIVRSTTSTRIIKMLRRAGAKEVHMRISSPPFKYECYFGTDIDNRDNLVANHYDVDGICEKIGADSLEYLSLENLKAISPTTSFCLGCFTGDYPSPVTPMYKNTFDDGPKE
ncbi:MAG: amidophosphoribosyltransferase [Clostridiales bacterium]|nr:amidophosphoribosyltransferase [Clostridiales bacterium]